MKENKTLVPPKEQALETERDAKAEELESTFSYDGYQVVQKELFAHLRDGESETYISMENRGGDIFFGHGNTEDYTGKYMSEHIGSENALTELDDLLREHLAHSA